MKKTKGSLAFILAVVMLLCISIPALAAEVPADKYTYSLSGQTGSQSEKLELEEYDDNQSFRDILAAENNEIILVKEGAEITFTPKEKMRAIVNYYSQDGSGGGALLWTINGSEEMVNELAADQTATVKLSKSYGGFSGFVYYVFSFGEGEQASNIIYLVSDDTTPPVTKPEPVEPPTAQAQEILPPPADSSLKPIETATANPSVSKVLVNGKQVAFEAYNINSNTFFKLRDIAMAVNGTEKGFEVGWDEKNQAISLSSGEAYTPQGGELAVSTKPAAKKASLSTAKLYLDEAEVQLTAYTIGGNNYFKLRDLAEALDFTITFEAATNTIGIDTAEQSN